MPTQEASEVVAEMIDVSKDMIAPLVESIEMAVMVSYTLTDSQQGQLHVDRIKTRGLCCDLDDAIECVRQQLHTLQSFSSSVRSRAIDQEAFAVLGEGKPRHMILTNCT